MVKKFNSMDCISFLRAKVLIIRDKIILGYCKYLINKNKRVVEECNQRAKKIDEYLETVRNRL